MTTQTDIPLDDDLTEDRLLDGRVVMRQRRDGYRAGMDAALLAASVSPRPGQRLLEAGCGAGAVLLQLAARHPELHLTGVERDPDAADLAGGNVRLNGFKDRISILTGDIARGQAILEGQVFDHAVANPPFFDDESALRPPSAARRSAWIADDGLDAWGRFLALSVRDGGYVTLIHRADRLFDIARALETWCGGFAIRPVHAHDDQPAKRVIVRARKGGRGPVRLLPALVLNDRATGRGSVAADDILRGRADIDFDDRG